ncbi:late exocytosis, associated with Golgi transport-domain-containing protein [Suillus occidentalis]|nr:late exocytosis, associated with Golgi transport-domain-containing protein [Suillus occidentalis]
MADIQNRPFSKDYSGLVNQSVITIVLAVVSVTLHEIMKRRRRGLYTQPAGLGSVESWEFGYLYQGRSWARHPSPPTPKGWPLSWVKDSITFPRAKLNELRGVDATLYVRFLRGTLLFVLVHTFTTTPILLPIHVHFSPDGVSAQSMTRASISSLVETQQGRSLLWIHICLLFWITLTWMCNLFYICNEAFRLRAAKIESAIRSMESDTMTEREAQYYPHPHPQYPFQDIPSLDTDHSNRGLRLRTVMVTNVPVQLRSEKELKEYFEYYLSRSLDKPFVGLPASTQPGLLNKLFAFGFNRAKRIPQNIAMSARENCEWEPGRNRRSSTYTNSQPTPGKCATHRPGGHCATDDGTGVVAGTARGDSSLFRGRSHHVGKEGTLAVYSVEHRHGLREGTTVPKRARSLDEESGYNRTHNEHQNKDIDMLVRTLSPFLVDYELTSKFAPSRRRLILRTEVDSATDNIDAHKTIWDALLSLPRNILDHTSR